MSYRSRVLQAEQEVLYVSVKDLHGPNRKKISMAYETYLTLNKEMEISIISIIHAGNPKAYERRLHPLKDTKYGTLPSQTGKYKMFVNVEEAEEAPPEIGKGGIPAPPPQNKVRLPGESSKDYHSRRIHEGKAYKKWEEDYGAAFAEYQNPSEDTEDIDKMFSGVGEEPEPEPEAVDPIKEQIEQVSLDQLLNKES